MPTIIIMPTGGGEEEEGRGRGGRIVNPLEMVGILAGLLIVVATLWGGPSRASILVVTTATNRTSSFADAEASFTPRVPNAGVTGVLYSASPSNACESLQSRHFDGSGVSAILLVERGDCSFVEKVQNAQNAGFAAVIVYNNVDGENLVTMSGSVTNIKIFAAFVSKKSGKALLKHVEDLTSRCLIVPALGNTAWSVMAVAFISFFAVSAVLSAFYLVRRNRYRRIGIRFWPREPKGMSAKEVKALPIVTYDSAGSGTSEVCAICLEDYVNAEKLRVLHCHHGFHVACIDQWLTTQRPFCPICKRDVRRTKGKEAVLTERTPLLGSLARFWDSSTSPPLPPSASEV